MNSLPDKVTKPSVLAPDLEVTGNIHSTGDLIVQAQVTGNIAAATAAIHPWASIKGDIEAHQVTVDGRVEGHITGGSVTVSHTGQIVGSLAYTSLAVREGATIDGDLKRVVPSSLPQG